MPGVAAQFTTWVMPQCLSPATSRVLTMSDKNSSPGRISAGPRFGLGLFSPWCATAGDVGAETVAATEDASRDTASSEATLALIRLLE
jgi:hypothetical protein